MNFSEIIKDPDFLGLPQGEQQKVLMQVDADFAGLPPPEQIKVLTSIYSGQMFIANIADLFLIQGTGPNTFMPLKMSAVCGTMAKQCFLPVTGHGIFHLGSEGIYLFKIGSDINTTESAFGSIFHGESSGSMPGMNLSHRDRCWMIQHRGKFYFGYPGGEDEWPKDLIVTELSSGRSVHYQYPFGIICVTVDQASQRLLAGCDDGFVRTIEEVNLTDDDGDPIAWDIETMQFSAFRKYFPRYARYDVDIFQGSIVNGFIKLDGAEVQTHPITSARKIRKRLITTCTGDRLSIRLAGSGAVDIYTAEVE